MKITDKILYENAAQARDIWLSSLPEDGEVQEHYFSQEFLSGIEHKKSAAGRKPGVHRVLRTVAAVFLVFLMGSGTFFGMNPQARAAFVSWVREVLDDRVVYQYSGRSPEGAIDPYRCSWLPDGMEATQAYGSRQSGTVVYSSSEREFAAFSYSYMDSGTTLNLFPSTEETLTHATLQINGLPADLYTEAGEEQSCLIVWFDEENQIFYTISGNLTAETTVDMARSVVLGTAMEYMPRYVFTWLPEGYEAQATSWATDSRAETALGEGGMFRLDYLYPDRRPLHEQFNLSEIEQQQYVMVGELQGELYLHDNQKDSYLTWIEPDSGIAFCLESTADMETVLRVAEGVRKE